MTESPSRLRNLPGSRQTTTMGESKTTRFPEFFLGVTTKSHICLGHKGHLLGLKNTFIFRVLFQVFGLKPRNCSWVFLVSKVQRAEKLHTKNSSVSLRRPNVTPLVNDHIAGWKSSPFFNRKYIDSIRVHVSASYVSLPECTAKGENPPTTLDPNMDIHGWYGILLTHGP